MGEWIDVREKLPPSNDPVLAFFLNALGKRRIVRAQYAAPHTLALDDDCAGAGACECAGCRETGDAEWCAEGWYEDNEYEEIHWRVSNEVTHWMPLPEPPRSAE